MVERGPEKAGVGGSIPSLATIINSSWRWKATSQLAAIFAADF